MANKFEIKKNVEINLEVEVRDGGISFLPVNLDTGNDWASYSLETTDGDLVAEHVSFEPLQIHNEELLIEWYKTTYPAEVATCDDEDLADCAEEKLNQDFGSPDRLYEYSKPEAAKVALEAWLEQEQPKIYRNDLRGFGNEFDLTFVMEGAEYTPGDSEYELSPEDAVKYAFMYVNDPTTENYSSMTIVEA